MKIMIWALVALMATGCSGMQADGLRMANEGRASWASGSIGCPPSEIKISDHLINSWTATCRGQVFYCSESPTAACKASM